MQENVNTLLYNDFIEELVDVLEVKDEKLMVGTIYLDFIVSPVRMYVRGILWFSRRYAATSAASADISSFSR